MNVRSIVLTFRVLSIKQLESLEDFMKITLFSMLMISVSILSAASRYTILEPADTLPKEENWHTQPLLFYKVDSRNEIFHKSKPLRLRAEELPFYTCSKIQLSHTDSISPAGDVYVLKINLYDASSRHVMGLFFTIEKSANEFLNSFKNLNIA